MTTTVKEFSHQLPRVLGQFIAWLDNFGETSFDHQSYFAGPIGGRAKALYYRRPKLGTLVVAPMIISEAFLPSARQLFWKKQRFPIADAHYAMGFAALARATGKQAYLERAVHFLDVLVATRSPGYERHGWGYPFDWVTRTGVMNAGTPLITSTPYVYEAFAAVHAIDRNERWQSVMRSIAEHALLDIKDRPVGPDSASAGYNPLDTEGGVINASAYRAFLLTAAAQKFGRDDYWRAAQGNLKFVLRAQRPDGSWFYAVDGVRTFIDHFHTCFVLKALAKVERLRGDGACTTAIDRGVHYYLRNLFDAEGLPRPFSSAPRLTVYRSELYDYAECLNLCHLLRGRSNELDECFTRVMDDLLSRWQLADGRFRSRRLLLGWDDVPMHRWAQSQVFRSLCLTFESLCNASVSSPAMPDTKTVPAQKRDRSLTQ
jgi:hypothetical protein